VRATDARRRIGPAPRVGGPHIEREGSECSGRTDRERSVTRRSQFQSDVAEKRANDGRFFRLRGRVVRRTDREQERKPGYCQISVDGKRVNTSTCCRALDCCRPEISIQAPRRKADQAPERRVGFQTSLGLEGVLKPRHRHTADVWCADKGRHLVIQHICRVQRPANVGRERQFP